MIIAFPLQQWSHERASMLRYTYIAPVCFYSAHTCTCHVSGDQILAIPQGSPGSIPCIYTRAHGAQSCTVVELPPGKSFFSSVYHSASGPYSLIWPTQSFRVINLIKPTGYVMHHQFNIQQMYALPTLYLCVLYLSENKQRLVPLTA